MTMADPGDERRLLREAAAGALARLAAPSRFTLRDADAVAIAAETWALAQAMGWPGLMVPEDRGGQGLDLASAATLAEEMGRHLFCGPFSTTAVLAVTLAGIAEAPAWRDRLLPAIARGEIVLALGASPLVGAAARLAFAPGSSLRLSGLRDPVEHPALATDVLALDIVQDRDGGVALTAAVVAATGAGVCRDDLQAFDVTCPIARFRFSDAAVADGLVLRARLDQTALDALLRPFHVVIAAELVGVAAAALDGAVAHARTRSQFGQPIGSFQAVKHRLADVHVQLESARLATGDAARDGAAAGSGIAARLLATEAALAATGAFVQVLGGMGFSWESPAHLYLKRARRLAALLADPGALRARLAARFIGTVLERSPRAS